MLEHRFQRIVEFQRVTLKMIAEDVLRSCPSTDKDALAQGLSFLGDQLQCAKLCLKKPVILMVSEHNPGAASLAEELAATFDGITIKMATTTEQSERSGRRIFSWLLDFAESSSLTSAKRAFFLLYLNERTFLEEAGERFANQVRAVHERDPRGILLVHENDAARGGCEFGRWRCTHHNCT